MSILSIVGTLPIVSFNEVPLATAVIRNALDALFKVYDPANKKQAAPAARAGLNNFVMAFDARALTQFNHGIKQFDGSNAETIEDLISAGYAKELWNKGIDFDTYASQGITEEEKKETIHQAAYELVETVMALGVKEIDGEELVLEQAAARLDTSDKIKIFLDRVKAIHVNIPEETLDRFDQIIAFIELKESEQVLAVHDAVKFRVTIKKDFLNEATAGQGVPGCFNPQGIHREMPLIHALESNAGFIQVYNESGKQVANAVLVYTPQGVYAYPGYNSSSYNMDLIFGKALAQLTQYVPSLVLDSSSAGYSFLAKMGEISNNPITLIKPGTVFKDQYYDSGKVDNTGLLMVTVSRPLTVTRQMVLEKGGLESFQLKSQATRSPAETIDFQKLFQVLQEAGLSKYSYLIGDIRKKIAEERAAGLVIDFEFYDWVRERINQRLRGHEMPVEEADVVADHIIGFLEAQEFPMDIQTPIALDAAMSAQKPMLKTTQRQGGIDFKADKMNIEIKTDSRTRANDNIQFHLDPALLKELENAPGFTPVIINIRPMTNLLQFMGLEK